MLSINSVSFCFFLLFYFISMSNCHLSSSQLLISDFVHFSTGRSNLLFGFVCFLVRGCRLRSQKVPLNATQTRPGATSNPTTTASVDCESPTDPLAATTDRKIANNHQQARPIAPEAHSSPAETSWSASACEGRSGAATAEAAEHTRAASFDSVIHDPDSNTNDFSAVDGTAENQTAQPCGSHEANAVGDDGSKTRSTAAHPRSFRFRSVPGGPD